MDASFKKDLSETESTSEIYWNQNIPSYKSGAVSSDEVKNVHLVDFLHNFVDSVLNKSILIAAQTLCLEDSKTAKQVISKVSQTDSEIAQTSNILIAALIKDSETNVDLSLYESGCYSENSEIINCDYTEDANDDNLAEDNDFVLDVLKLRYIESSGTVFNEVKDLLMQPNSLDASESFCTVGCDLEVESLTVPPSVETKLSDIQPLYKNVNEDTSEEIIFRQHVEVDDGEGAINQKEDVYDGRILNESANLIEDTKTDDEELMENNEILNESSVSDAQGLSPTIIRENNGDNPETQFIECHSKRSYLKESGRLFSSWDSFLTDSSSEDLTADHPPSKIKEQPEVDSDKSTEATWKVGYLYVKLPRKGHLKVWRRRRVVAQPDEFSDDSHDSSLLLGVYGQHSALFWKTVSAKNAQVFRSSSGSQKFAFTVSEGGRALVHLAGDSETESQQWMDALRTVLWPPSPDIQLEKILCGTGFEVSLIDNSLSVRAGMSGAYGHLHVTSRKLTLVHPHQGHVVQEWYLSTVHHFRLVPQSKARDHNKVLQMTTGSESSIGRGVLLFYCSEAVTLLQSLASTIHDILSHQNEGGVYQKEMEEMAHWLHLPTPEEHYKVPSTEVKSLLDIPNFTFDAPVQV